MALNEHPADFPYIAGGGDKLHVSIEQQRARSESRGLTVSIVSTCSCISIRRADLGFLFCFVFFF